MKKTVVLLVALGCARDRSDEGAPPARAPGVLDIDAPIVARVGDEFVTKAELQRAFALDRDLQILNASRRAAKEAGKWTDAAEEEYLRAVEKIRMLVARKVILSHHLATEALKRGILPPDYDIERRLHRNPEIIAEAQKRGYTVDELRADVRRQALLEALSRADGVGPTSTPSPTRVRSFYEEHKAEMLRPDCVKLRVISIARRKKDPILGTIEVPEARPKAEKIAAELSLKPSRFADYAKKYSEDPETADRGGLVVIRSAWGTTDLVPRKALEKDKWLKEAVEKLEPGQTSPVVETAEAFHVIKLDAETPPETPSFEDAQEMIVNILQRQDTGRAQEEWFRRMASRAVVTDGLGRPIELESLSAGTEE